VNKPFQLLPLGLLFTAACTTMVGPDYEVPDAQLQESHRADLAALDALFGRSDAGVLDLGVWWASFDDPVLSGLIERSVIDNFDLRQTLSRIAEAEARLGISRSERGPRADFGAAYVRSGISENTQFGLFPGQKREQDSYSATLSASWEIDVWGKARRSIEAAEADLGARIEGLWAVRVSLAGQVADAYLRLRELQSRTDIANENVKVLAQSVDVVSARVQAGLVEELDLLRARTELESARANLPALASAEAAVVTELGLLLGAEPGELDELFATGASEIPSPVGRLGTQVPRDLLRRRPDVRMAERELAAQTARVGVATADLYPSFSLVGSLGLLSEKPENLLDGTSFTHSLSPAVNLPLFSGGAIRANIRVEDQRVDQALLAWESSVLAALHEVDGAATALRFEAQRLAALERAAAEATRSLERSRTLYREGLITIDAVLDARRALFAIEDTRAQSRGSLARAHVDLYRALGGGWPA